MSILFNFQFPHFLVLPSRNRFHNHFNKRELLSDGSLKCQGECQILLLIMFCGGVVVRTIYTADSRY